MPIHKEILTKLRQNHPGLTYVNLSHQNLTTKDIHIFLQALASNSALTELNLSFNQIDAEGAIALAKNSTLIQLDLEQNQIGAEGAKALAGNSTLTQLNLTSNQIGDEGAKALAGNKTLTQLNLGANQIGDEGAKALAGNSTLTQLNLLNNRIGAEGAKALAGNKTLTQLNLGYNKIGPEGTKALAENKTLTQLNLRGNQIDAEGAKALAGNSTLTQLDLENNQIGDEGAIALAENSTLTQLNLRENKIGAKGAKAFVDNSILTQLNLLYNQIGAEGAKALAENKTLTQLDLEGNQIGDEGAKALAGNSTLTQLNLRSNQIGAEGAIALAENKTLTQLDLERNQIGAESAKAFLENLTLTRLDIEANDIGKLLKQRLDAHIIANRVRAEQKVQEEIKLAHASSEKSSLSEADKLPMATLSLLVSPKEDKATETVDTASPQSSFFKPLVDEEQTEKARVYDLAASLQSVITDCLPVNVTISRGKYLEIQAQEEEVLEELSREALRLTLARLFGDELSLMPDNRYRIAWSSLSAGQSEAFASLYEAEYQCLLEASATKTSTFSEAETLNTASFVDALDNDPVNKVKFAAALQSLIEGKVAVEVGRKQGMIFSIRGLSEVLPQEQTKAQALRDTLQVLTVGSSARFSEDSIILSWDSLRARYVREFDTTFEALLMRLESSVSMRLRS